MQALFSFLFLRGGGIMIYESATRPVERSTGDVLVSHEGADVSLGRDPALSTRPGAWRWPLLRPRCSCVRPCTSFHPSHCSACYGGGHADAVTAVAVVSCLFLGTGRVWRRPTTHSFTHGAGCSTR